MFRRFILWWKVRGCESDLRFLRKCQRENPDDPRPKELIPLVEKAYHELELERTCRRRGWHWAFTCWCCHRESVSFVPPVACRFCGLDAPQDVKLTVPELLATNGQQHEGEER